MAKFPTPNPLRWSVSRQALAVIIMSVAISPGRGDDSIEFNRDIRPLLSDRCFQCHGPDEKKREADLRLDLGDDVIGNAILPGAPESSELMMRVVSDDASVRMPPPESGKSLSQDEIGILKRWIAQGAPYQKHWAFESPRTVPIPPTRSTEWPHSPIDSFILARLQQSELLPSTEADRATLIKRLSFDLTGLIPAPEEVDRFVNDDSPAAYGRLVDRLLASPHFGERVGRHWLDLARYADSNGYANDGLRSIWPYRDWVINALNADMPFDQFTTEQLAGDLLPGASESQVVATGFHRNTPLQTEGGSDPEQYRVERTKNRTDTTGTVWFGLTVGCAQCHTHKFDPITQHEYYSLYAFFNGADEPTRTLTDAATQDKLAKLSAQIAACKQKIEELEATAVDDGEEGKSAEPAWQVIELESFVSEGGATFRRLDDGSILAGGKNPDVDTYVLSGRFESPTRAIRIEALTDPSLPGGGPGRAGNGNFVLAEMRLQVNEKARAIVGAIADHAQSGYPVADAFDGDDSSGWAINVKGGSLHVDRRADFVLASDVAGAFELRLTSYRQGNGYNIGRLRLSASPHAPKTPIVDPRIARVRSELKRLEREQKDLRGGLVTTLVMAERRQPRKTHVQIRGDFLDPGDEVTATPLSALHAWQAPEGHAANRLDLANWITSERNPLTARVVVNRIWQRMFGSGLVETENDFGYQGSLPSHPALLDHLARDFVAGGWSVKSMYRQIALSSAYRQSSARRKEVDAVDPKNRLLARQSRHRVEAEIIRDLGLSGSGLLARTLGGPGVFPPISPGVIGTSSAKHRWPESRGGDRYRRGIYTTIYRANVHPMLTTFDGPDRDNACTRRGRSNTPLQALTLANNAAMVEMAVALAKDLVGTDTSDEPIDANGELVTLAFRRLMCRQPSTDESERITAFQSQRLAHYQRHPDDAVALVGEDNASLAAWAATCRVLMNLDEFITRE